MNILQTSATTLLALVTFGAHANGIAIGSGTSGTSIYSGAAPKGSICLAMSYSDTHTAAVFVTESQLGKLDYLGERKDRNYSFTKVIPLAKGIVCFKPKKETAFYRLDAHSMGHGVQLYVGPSKCALREHDPDQNFTC